MTNRSVTAPEQFFGHRMGADRKIVRWDRMVEYYRTIAGQSDRIEVRDLGPSTEGNPFLLVTISSAENLARQARLRAISARLANPQGLSEGEVEALVDEGAAVVCQTMSLHASEIGGTQMSPELAYELVTGEDAETRLIRDNVVFLMIPCFNPDGQIMVTDWYNRWLGTEHEGCMLPWLYHKYTGHDNNRDAFALNIPESRYVARIMFREWCPQAYQDHHHMGGFGARLYVAPYCNPIHPHGDPLIWREHAWYGAHMAYKLEQAGKTGIINAAQYGGWAHMGFHWLTIYHNIAGMLTESASAKLASPMYVHPGQLRGSHPRTMPEYEAQTNFPNPWPGGWWHLRDIVEQQKIAARAVLDIAARFKETVLRNAYLKASRQTERGATGSPRAFVIPADQHDPLTARKLVRLLLDQGIEVQYALSGLRMGDRVADEGSYVVSLAQPKMGVIKTLLGRTRFPDNYWTRGPDGTPIIYDTTTDTVGEYMGIDVVPVDGPIGGQLTGITDVPCPAGTVADLPLSEGGTGCYVLDPRLNDSYRAVNRLLAQGVTISRTETGLEAGGRALPAGAFLILDGASDDTVKELASELGVDFAALRAAGGVPARPLRALRIGMYQRYWGGNMDEGWTRLVLEKFGFDYLTLMDKDIKAGSLRDKVDVLILPTDRRELLAGPDEFKDKPQMAMMMARAGSMPTEYRSGLGKEGAKAIADFVSAGGRLVALDGAAGYAVQCCGLPVKNVVEGVEPKDYTTHGAMLRALVDTGDPLGYGMPAEALVLSWNSPAFDILDAFRAEDYRIVVRYPASELLQSGLLIGEERIRGKAVVVAVRKGPGEVVLFGCRPQFRAQTHGTFKLFFNCLYGTP